MTHPPPDPGARGGAMCAATRVEQATLELTVIRADGRREPLGVVGYWHRNPLRRLAHKATWFLAFLKQN